MNRIDAKFKELRREKKKAFIAFLTAGYPSLSATERLVLEAEKNGADIIELGVPFSDPIADGPVIQMSSYKALRRGTTLRKVLALVKRLRRKTRVPLAAMSYYNPILQYGPRKFIRDAARAGFDAAIIPDLPAGEEVGFVREAARGGLPVISFIAPTTSKERMRAIARRARGFIYFVSLTGVTGARRQLPPELKVQVTAARKAAGRVPVCAGFGVSTRAQVAHVSSFCDGVIVGSALIRQIEKDLKRGGFVKAAGRLVRHLKG